MVKRLFVLIGNGDDIYMISESETKCIEAAIKYWETNRRDMSIFNYLYTFDVVEYYIDTKYEDEKINKILYGLYEPDQYEDLLEDSNKKDLIVTDKYIRINY